MTLSTTVHDLRAYFTSAASLFHISTDLSILGSTNCVVYHNGVGHSACKQPASITVTAYLLICQLISSTRSSQCWTVLHAWSMVAASTTTLRLFFGIICTGYESQRVTFKCCLVNKAKNGLTPGYITDFCIWTSSYLTFGWINPIQTGRSKASSQICWTFFFSVWPCRMELFTIYVVNICWNF